MNKCLNFKLAQNTSPMVHKVQLGAPGPNLDCRHPHSDNLKTGKAFYAQHLGQGRTAKYPSLVAAPNVRCAISCQFIWYTKQKLMWADPTGLQ